MPQFGPPDQRDRSRNRRTRRRGGTGQIMRGAPVTEYDEAAELEAARERNDLDVSDLREMSVNELRQVSRELELETGTQERKEDLVERILERQTERAGLDYASGILDIVDEGFGFLRRHGLLPGPDDVYVSSSQVRRFGLRIGDRVSGAVRAPREGEKYWGLLRVDAVNGVDVDMARRRPVFNDLTPVHPDVLINLETDPKNLSQRLINVVNLLDSITRLARAYNLALPPSGRTLSGGIDPIALYPPKRFFGAARNIEEGGSLTIIGTCLVDTGSRMDDVIYEEFKGTGNSELILDRKLAEKRIFPAIDVQRSGTRREELLLEDGTLKMVWTMRRMLSAVGTNEGIELLLNRIAKTETNAEFLATLTKSLD